LPGAEPRVTDNPAAAGAQPSSPAPVVPAPVQTAQAAPVQKAPAAVPFSTAEATGVFISVPEKASSYWQVTAVQRPAADALVKSLRESKLPAILAESSNPKLFRVLVGPYRSTSMLADAKRKLTDLSFGDLILQKY
jgi:cell division septation protein DedD